MHSKYLPTLAIVLTAPLFWLGGRAEADGLLKRIHHHQQDCPAEQSVVRLPAQEIRIETARPRVVVNQISSPARMRGYFPHHHGFVGAPQGFVAAPMVATILAPGSFQFGSSAPPPSSATMDLAHALERQTAEISAARAHRLAIQAAEDAALLRVRQQVANMSVGPADVKASTSDAAQLAKAIEDLSNRVTAMEKLLIIHDDLIRKKLQPEKKTP